MKLQLTPAERMIVRNVSWLRIIGWGVTVFGLLGIPLGLYANYYQEMCTDARSMNQSLLAYSIGLFFIGIFLSQTLTIIRKMAKQKEEYQ